MYHILHIAGQQFILKQGQKQFVPHIEGKVGDTVELDSAVLLSFTKDKAHLPSKIKQKVVVKIENQIKGDKVIAFKMKRRKGFRKKLGHRTQYTQISLQSIV